jgi:hypothetical protein
LNYGRLWLKEEGSIVQMYPVPESELDVRVNFALTETPPASGEKSPDNPSTITGVSSAQVVRCGKNLYKPDTMNTIFNINGRGCSSFVLPAGSYTVKWDAYTTTYPYIHFYIVNYLTGAGIKFVDLLTTGGSGTFTVTAPFRIAYYYNGWANSAQYVSRQNEVGNISLVTGSTATPYTPYEGDTYTIPLGDTYYGGYVDSERGVLVKEWEEVVLDGTENWDNFNGVIPYTQMTLPSYGISAVDCILCTNYTSALIATYGVVTINPAAKNRLIVRPTAEQAFSGITDFKSWLAAQYAAGTPVKVVYKLATPVEIPLSNLPKILSLPQSDRYTPKLNNVFSNTNLPTTVGYAKSPIQEHTDITNTIVATGGANV